MEAKKQITTVVVSGIENLREKVRAVEDAIKELEKVELTFETLPEEEQ